MIPYNNNQQRKALNPHLGAKDFTKSLAMIQQLHSLQTILKGLVLDVDREGGMFDILRGANGGLTDIVSPPFTLKVRLLTNLYNNDTENSLASLAYDEYFVLPINSPNIIDIPERGEIVNIQFDKPLAISTGVIGYYFGRALEFATKEYTTTFKRREASQQKSITHSGATIYGGEKPKTIDYDYNIKPNWNYEPFPEYWNRKAGDVLIVGKSNTIIRHTFSAFKEKDDTDVQSENPAQDDKKRGVLELGTEYGYAENEKEMTEFSYDDESKRSGLSEEEFEAIRLNHMKKYLDVNRDTSNWEYLPSRGSRLILATKLNVDARLIHPDTAFDWTGKFGNIKKYFDKHFNDVGKGRFCGDEILKETIRFNYDFSTQHGDALLVFAKERDHVTFDENVSTVFSEADAFRFIGKKGGKNINHGVLGEELVRLLQFLIMVLLHNNRSLDILNDNVYRLSEDFLSHIHAVKPGVTNSPLGSPKSPAGLFVKEHPYYDVITSSDVAGDSKEFEEKGSYAPASGLLKDRTKEERELLELIAKNLPDVLSNVFAFN